MFEIPLDLNVIIQSLAVWYKINYDSWGCILPFLHCSLPQLESAKHVPLLVDEGGAEQLQGVDPLLLPHQLPLADQVLHDVQVACK